MTQINPAMNMTQAIPLPLVAGQKICLVPLDKQHLEHTRVWVNDPELMKLLDRSSPISDLEHERWSEKLHEQKNCLYFAIETTATRKHIGNVWLWDIDQRHRKAVLRILIGDKAELEQGMGSEAMTLACTYAFERLNLHRVYAYVLSTNPRAKAAFERAGFALEGTLKEDRFADSRFVDVYFLGKLA